MTTCRYGESIRAIRSKVVEQIESDIARFLFSRFFLFLGELVPRQTTIPRGERDRVNIYFAQPILVDPEFLTNCTPIVLTSFAVGLITARFLLSRLIMLTRRTRKTCSEIIYASKRYSYKKSSSTVNSV